MWVLGITGSHNAAATLVRDGRVVVAVQAERLTRKKRQSLFLSKLDTTAAQLIQYCLDYAGIRLTDVEYIATCTPWSHIHAAFDPAATEQLRGSKHTPPRFISVPHHLAHAEYVLHYSPLERGLVLICDGSGTWHDLRPKLDVQENESSAKKIFLGDEGPAKESISAYSFEDGDLRLIYRACSRRSASTPQGKWFNSFGHLWRWVARYCHGSVHDAGKVMGLAAYGDPAAHDDLEYISISDSGDIRLDYSPLTRRFLEPNQDRRDISGEQHYADLAAHLQRTTDEFLVRLVQYLQARFPTDTLYYSGGVALNSVANDHLVRALGLNFHVNGSCEDNGTAIGAALAVHHHLTGERISEDVTEYYGRHYDRGEIKAALREENLDFRVHSDEEIFDVAARAIADGQVVGWFQGRSEFGPRALGNRSILADPRKPDMQDIVNKRIKFREPFRPFAPAVLEERAEEYFDLGGKPSPLMLRVAPVRVNTLPSITHFDDSARVQTVTPKQNPTFYRLIERFGETAGTPVVLNTSFNLAGEPIVETPRDAIRTFLNSGMDALILGTAITEK